MWTRKNAILLIQTKVNFHHSLTFDAVLAELLSIGLIRPLALYKTSGPILKQVILYDTAPLVYIVISLAPI